MTTPRMLEYKKREEIMLFMQENNLAETDEYDNIISEMDDIWYEMTTEEQTETRNRVKKLSENNFSIHEIPNIYQTKSTIYRIQLATPPSKRFNITSSTNSKPTITKSNAKSAIYHRESKT